MQVDNLIFSIVLGIAFGLGLAFIPSLIKYINEKRKARKAVFEDSMEILRTIREDEKKHFAINEGQIEELLENLITPKRLCKKFKN